MNEPISAIIYNTLREEIASGELKANCMLTEREVAERFNVSRVPVREAFQQLCNESYLLRYPKRGYLVHAISDEHLAEIQQVRFQLESLAVVLVIKNCSDNEIKTLTSIPDSTNQTNPYHTANTYFHRTLAELSGNRLLSENVYRLLGDASMAFFQHEKKYKSTPNYHKEIIEALLKRDTESALKALALDMTFNNFEQYHAVLPIFN